MRIILLCCVVLVGNAWCDEQVVASAIQDAIFGGGDPILGSSRDSESTQHLSLDDLSTLSLGSARRQSEYYHPGQDEGLPILEPCPAVSCHLSLAVVMDASASVGSANFQLQLTFVQTLIEILTLKAADSGVKVCLGVVTYSTEVEVVVDPCCSNSLCKVVELFSNRNVDYNSGSTNTHGALKVARQMIQGPRSIKRQVLLITDGKSNTGGSPVEFAREMRMHDDVGIVAFGVSAGVQESELSGISGMSFVTRIETFDDFHETAVWLLQSNAILPDDLFNSFEEYCRPDMSTFTDVCTREDEVVTEAPVTEAKVECSWHFTTACEAKKNKKKKGKKNKNKKCFTYGDCHDDYGNVVEANVKHECVCPERFEDNVAMSVGESFVLGGDDSIILGG